MLKCFEADIKRGLILFVFLLFYSAAVCQSSFAEQDNTTKDYISPYSVEKDPVMLRKIIEDNSTSAYDRELAGVLLKIALNPTQYNMSAVTDDNATISTPTRSRQFIKKTPYDYSILTQMDIETFHASTVEELLNYVTGFFVEHNGQNFGGPGLYHINNSLENQVLVLLDGVELNNLNSGVGITNSIPVEIIDKIEIIRGPASSVWGSSLGGVINIITKTRGRNFNKPDMTVKVLYGSNNIQDYNIEARGIIEKLRMHYYLDAGRQYGSSMTNNRALDKNTLFSKFSYNPDHTLKVNLHLFYTKTKDGFGDLKDFDLKGEGLQNNFLGKLSMDYKINSELQFSTSIYSLQLKNGQLNYVLGVEDPKTTGDLYLGYSAIEKTIGGDAKLVWQTSNHSVVFGTDIKNTMVKTDIDVGSILQSYGAAPFISADTTVTKYAVYLNDTISLGKASFIPGIRYDYNNINGYFVSPSIGFTYELDNMTLFRATTARGFTSPTLSGTSTGGLFLKPNPDLKPVEIYSYQAGIETTHIYYISFKTTAFYHDIRNSLKRVYFTDTDGSYTSTYRNEDTIRRKGFSVEMASVPIFKYFRINYNLTYVWDYLPSTNESTSSYDYNATLKFEKIGLLKALLAAHYIRWNKSFTYDAHYNDVILNLHLTKAIDLSDTVTTELYLSAYNMFNGEQYNSSAFYNPDRWFLGGIRFRF
ncbi:MAG: TonB-dependent receptor [Nitrospirae bacterium YQR-1]